MASNNLKALVVFSIFSFLSLLVLVCGIKSTECISNQRTKNSTDSSLINLTIISQGADSNKYKKYHSYNAMEAEIEHISIKHKEKKRRAKHQYNRGLLEYH
ncbi:MAG: hypothetical protein ACYDCN_03590 [Bacteroidia bacterium]